MEFLKQELSETFGDHSTDTDRIVNREGDENEDENFKINESKSNSYNVDIQFRIE